jgi:hypothetical protein
MECATSILITCTELLSVLIGEDVTTRLTQSALKEPASTPEEPSS